MLHRYCSYFCLSHLQLYFKLFVARKVEVSSMYIVMGKKSVFLILARWIKSFEGNIWPSKQLPGRWELTEYYIEPEGQLINIKEEQIRKEAGGWEIEFSEDNFIQHNYPAIHSLVEIENGTWSVSRNFITLIHPKDFRKNFEFQFAIEKGQLKLLKKDNFGKIVFFGFFRKLEFS